MTRIGNMTDQTVDMSLGVKSPVITHETRDGSDAKPGRDTSTPYNNRYFFSPANDWIFEMTIFANT